MRAILTLLLTSVFAGLGLIVIGVGVMTIPWPGWMTSGLPAIVAFGIVIAAVALGWVIVCGRVVQWLVFRGYPDEADSAEEYEDF